MEEEPAHSQVVPAVTAGCYLVAGLAWIWWSGEAGHAIFKDVEGLARFERWKGFAFIFVTALVLYGWLAASLKLAHAQLERRIADRTAELEGANRTLESFTYSVAHDLRAPVAHVEGFARALEDTIRQRDPEKAWHFTQRIVANAHLMSEMIEGMLHVSRAERATVQHEPIDMTALVKGVVEELAPGGAVAIAIDPLPGALADRALLRQVWSNLIANAVKYSARAEQPRVSVSASNGSGEIVYCVQDNGVGFDPAEGERLFNAFQRLSNARSFAGSGVGLAIIKRIVERHGGRVWATGEPGRGARFCFSVPATR
jgi:light-regulated signal transduction histidine kinase (bacteriophytochrome)